MSELSGAGGDAEPTGEQVVRILFQAAMSEDPEVWAQTNGIDLKLLQVWKFTHAQEYITYLEKVLRMMKRRAGSSH